MIIKLTREELDEALELWILEKLGDGWCLNWSAPLNERNSEYIVELEIVPDEA